MKVGREGWSLVFFGFMMKNEVWSYQFQESCHYMSLCRWQWNDTQWHIQKRKCWEHTPSQYGQKQKICHELAASSWRLCLLQNTLHNKPWRPWPDKVSEREQERERKREREREREREEKRRKEKRGEESEGERGNNRSIGKNTYASWVIFTMD